MLDVLAGPTDQPRISRSTQDYSQETPWYTGNEEGEQDLYSSGSQQKASNRKNGYDSTTSPPYDE